MKIARKQRYQEPDDERKAPGTPALARQYEERDAEEGAEENDLGSEPAGQADEDSSQGRPARINLGGRHRDHRRAGKDQKDDEGMLPVECPIRGSGKVVRDQGDDPRKGRQRRCSTSRWTRRRKITQTSQIETRGTRYRPRNPNHR